MSWTRLGFVCDSQATSNMPSWCSLCAFCLNESHESNAQRHCHRISWRKYSIYPLCGQGLSSPPLSPEFCMQAGAAMWRRGLRDEGKGVGGGMGYPCPHPHPSHVWSVFSLFFSPPYIARFLYFSLDSLSYLYVCKRYKHWCPSLHAPRMLLCICWAGMFWLPLTLSKDWH